MAGRPQRKSAAKAREFFRRGFQIIDAGDDEEVGGMPSDEETELVQDLLNSEDESEEEAEVANDASQHAPAAAGSAHPRGR